MAEHFVAPLGRRWLHVQAVAARATGLTAAVRSDQRDDLVAAAWLHDIGYSPEIGHTRFHPLDGARYLRDSGWPPLVVQLVAHHSGARFEAIERGLSKQLLADFPFEDSPSLDALATADLTTGPGGEAVTYEERISEILSRYSPDDPVHRAWLRAQPVLAESIERTFRRMRNAQPK
ncbi:HD domain-containing protein [Pseudonocardia acaciae]|uniref:HD domain-containing protein n=1 Tax=Pseudonocardia acaciae TaxID=551276 RepID=UPI00316ADC37